MSRNCTTNPCGLTPREAEIMDAMTRLGNVKLVARELDLSPKTVEGMFGLARGRIGAANRIMAVLTWDRIRRTA